MYNRLGFILEEMSVAPKKVILVDSFQEACPSKDFIRFS